MLGIGGVRVLRGLGLEPTVFHMNEGHSAFLQLERLRELVEDEGLPRDAALQRLRASTVFTTHTPVPAGNEVFDARSSSGTSRRSSRAAASPGTSSSRSGASQPGDTAFGLTPFALRTSSYANGVSALHGEVSREMWQGLWPDRSIDDVPIGSVTNGVHARTWIGAELDALLGDEEDMGTPDFARAYELDDDALWNAHRAAKQELLRVMRLRGFGDGVRSRMRSRSASRAASRRTSAPTCSSATPTGSARLLGDSERPLQIVLAGKAHPADEGGKALIRKVVEFTRDPRANGRVVFLPDYEMTLARYLVQGVDVWLNNPRRPLEASGTSGMKAALNGVVNCLDPRRLVGARATRPRRASRSAATAIASNDAEQDAADAAALFACSSSR